MVKRPSLQPAHRFPAGRCFAVVGILLCAVALVGTAWAHGPRPASRALGPGQHLNLSPQDRCPVCAMRPIKYPRFASAIQLQDGTTFYFCSAGCMLKAWLRPDVFLNKASQDLKTPVALDYFSGQPTDARSVTWISGSDIIGPMGPALVPLKQADHVKAFGGRHGLSRVFRLEELNTGNWESLTGKPFHY